MAPAQVPLGLSLFPTKSCLRAGVVGGGHSVKNKHTIESCAVTQKSDISGLSAFAYYTCSFHTVYTLFSHVEHIHTLVRVLHRGHYCSLTRRSSVASAHQLGDFDIYRHIQWYTPT